MGRTAANHSHLPLYFPSPTEVGGWSRAERADGEPESLPAAPVIRHVLSLRSAVTRGRRGWLGSRSADLGGWDAGQRDARSWL